LLNLNSQLTKSKGQYDRREKLRVEAQENLSALRKSCKAKNDYFKRENARRQNELAITNSAIKTYNDIVTRVQARIASRVSSNFAGSKSYKSSDINEKNVADYRGTVHSSLDANVKSRQEVVL